MLLRWWPRLLPGLAASATHGVIRTAHAVRSLRGAGPVPDPLLVDELAQGLAFWAARYQIVPGDPPLTGPLDAVAATARVLAARDDAPIAFCRTVTAPAAVRLVLPELPDLLRWASVAASWQVVGAIVAAFAAPADETERDVVDTDPEPLLERLDPLAVEHGDEHVIKLTEAVGREYHRTGATALLVAADRFRGRIPRD